MNGIDELQRLLALLAPALEDEEYVFVTLPRGQYQESAALGPIAMMREEEGLSLVVSLARAREARLPFAGTFSKITLRVVSSLSAVGLSAKVASALAKRGISANIVAVFHHDHIFVPTDRARDALATLVELSEKGL